MECKMIQKLNMIINKNFNKDGVKIAQLFQNFITKKCPSESKMGLRDRLCQKSIIKSI